MTSNGNAARTNLNLDCPAGCAGCGTLAGPDRDGLHPFVVTHHYRRPHPILVWATCADSVLIHTDWQARACVRPATVADMADYAVALAEDEDREVTFALAGAR